VVSRLTYVNDEENLGTEIAAADGSSWAVVHHTQAEDRGHRVIQAGPRHLWDEIESVHGEWLAHDRPGHDRFGLSVGADAAPFLWLGSADSGDAWELATS
jgi:hypothetical protein